MKTKERRTEPCGRPISKSLGSLKKLLIFCFSSSVCELTVHKFKDFIRETVRKSCTLRSKALFKSVCSAAHDPPYIDIFYISPFFNQT